MLQHSLPALFGIQHARSMRATRSAGTATTAPTHSRAHLCGLFLRDLAIVISVDPREGLIAAGEFVLRNRSTFIGVNAVQELVPRHAVRPTPRRRLPSLIGCETNCQCSQHKRRCSNRYKDSLCLHSLHSFIPRLRVLSQA